MAAPLKPLSISEILKWADLHHQRTGKWPNSRAGRILDQPDRTWEAVQTALAKGTCGLLGGSSLHRLLRKHRKIFDSRIVMPELTLKEILRWADAHYTVKGQWPFRDYGAVISCPQITWATIDDRLSKGRLGLPRGTTLVRWLRDVRNVWDGGKPRLTEQLVLKWAREHFNRTGRWPVTMSGPVHNHPSENWAAIDVAMRNQRRGFPYCTSLSRLLRKHFGERYAKNIGLPRVKLKRREPRRITIARS